MSEPENPLPKELDLPGREEIALAKARCRTGLLAILADLRGESRESAGQTADAELQHT